eukprot:731105-Pleurochrysis_carterae.AAC.4
MGAAVSARLQKARRRVVGECALSRPLLENVRPRESSAACGARHALWKRRSLLKVNQLLHGPRHMRTIRRLSGGKVATIASCAARSVLVQAHVAEACVHRILYRMMT